MSTLDGFGWAGRLSRGRAYARNGRVLDVEVTTGTIRAHVKDTSPRPYRVEMTVEPFEDAVWNRVVGALARQAIYTAKLLAGDLPAEVVHLCDSAEAPLFPGHPDDISMRCTCPDWAVPCKHVAAVHYALAAELDHDPFLLFRLRGRTREELTAALRARRGSFGSAGAAKQVAEAAQQTADDAESAHEEVPVERFWEHGPELDDLHFEIRPPDVPGAVLRLLGRPPGWGGYDDLMVILNDLYQVASASVRDAAFADLDSDADPDERPVEVGAGAAEETVGMLAAAAEERVGMADAGDEGR
jgi:uncharacterized Zn finger protein